MRTYALTRRSNEDFLAVCMKQILIASALYTYNKILDYFLATWIIQRLSLMRQTDNNAIEVHSSDVCLNLDIESRKKL